MYQYKRTFILKIIIKDIEKRNTIYTIIHTTFHIIIFFCVYFSHVCTLFIACHNKKKNTQNDV